MYRGPDRPRAAPGGSGHLGGRGLPHAGGERADLLSLEATVCGNGHRRVAAAAPSRGGEPQADTARGRSEPGQAHAARGFAKQRVKPAQKRAVVRSFRAGFQVSGRRACRVVGVPRSSCRYRGCVTIPDSGVVASRGRRFPPLLSVEPILWSTPFPLSSAVRNRWQTPGVVSLFCWFGRS